MILRFFRKRVRKFLFPNRVKLVIFALLFILYIRVQIINPWGRFYSFIPTMLFNFVQFQPYFILNVAYIYFLSCLFAFLYTLIKKLKWVSIALVVVLLLFSGLDEPFINNTFNQPDLSCQSDDDCTVKYIKYGFCGEQLCVNSEWEYYEAMARSVLALSCAPNFYVCSCEEKQCITHDIYRSTNIEDCDMLSEIWWINSCKEQVSRNINASLS